LPNLYKSNSGKWLCYQMYDGEVKRKRKAAGQDSFVSCEARQSGVLSILPFGKGSQEWCKKDGQAELQM